ncbi:MAG: serine hydrolase domain-containing protein [Dehalococcoidia bacterium]|nr:serine hydrolase domain-containing protein [Dehalococcoidia bacterium]
MTTAIEVNGVCDSRFAAVRDAFAENFASRGEIGAAVAAVVDGETAVDLWAGHADAARSRPWQRDTIVNVFSATKGIATICAHRLADGGLLDIDAPVAKYWPEFAQAGKDELPVRYLLSHRAGLPAIKEPLPKGSLYRWDTMTDALAAQEPWWEPGTAYGYHVLTFGWLVGEVVRRIAGKSLGAYFRDEIAGPLGLDFHIGLAEEHDARTAEVVQAMPRPEEVARFAQLMADPQSMAFKAVFNPPDLAEQGLANTRAWRAAEIPAANGHGNARSLARLYGALARDGELDGVRVLSTGVIEQAIVEQSSGPDAVMGQNYRYGLGFMLTLPEHPFGPNPRAFGHTGAGGALGFADPDAGVGFAYTMNQMGTFSGLEDPRWPPLVDALYAAL